MSERTCQRCEKPLTGRQQKWCSDNCRRRACDDDHRAICQNCGGALCGRSGWASSSHRYEHCVPCRRELDRERRDARIERVAQMYRAGLTYREIASALGYSPNSKPWEVTAARRRGLIGYRRSLEHVVAMREARWGVAA